MIVLADNDVLLKLAQCDLFTEFLTAFEVTTDQVCIVIAARNSMKCQGSAKRIGEASAIRLLHILNAVSDIVTPPHSVFEAALSEQIGNGITKGRRCY